jgi:hypothetical protein
MSALSDIGASLVQTLTGTDPATLQQQVTAAEQQLTLAVETIIALEVIAIAELFLITVLLWKRLKD